MTNRIGFVAAAFVLFAALPTDGARAGGVYGDVVKQMPRNAANAPALPGVELRFCPSRGSGDCETTVTGSDGSFYVPDLAPGEYRIMTDSRQGGVSGSVNVPSGGDIGISITVP